MMWKLDPEEPQRMTTYRPANPDEFVFDAGIKWWTDLEWLDDFDDQTEVVEEVWVLESRRVFTHTPPCGERGCEEPAAYWGLCARHAREDDPEALEDAADA